MSIKVAKLGENVKHYNPEGNDTVGRVLERDGYDSTNPPTVKKGGVEVGTRDSVGDGDTLLITGKSVKGGGGNLGDGVIEIDYDVKFEESPKDSIVVSEGITAREFADKVRDNIGTASNILTVRDEEGNDISMGIVLNPAKDYTVVFEE